MSRIIKVSDNSQEYIVLFAMMLLYPFYLDAAACNSMLPVMKCDFY